MDQRYFKERKMSVLNKQASIFTTMALAMTACGGPRVDPPDVKLNPSPKDEYEITLTIQDSPRQIQAAQGSAQFDITNRECMPLKDKIAGIKPRSWFMLPVRFTRIRDNTFVGSILTDAILDADYYSIGTCRWELTGVFARFRVDKFDRVAIIDSENIIREESKTNFCPLVSYATTPCGSPTLITDDYRKENFTVVMKPRKEK